MGTLERFNLRWDGFEVNTKAALRQFKEEREFFDVTLVVSDGKQVEANKVVLAGGSSFFHKILKENPHPHPLIYLKGVSYQYLLSVLDFLYTGEANIVQNDLNGFLAVAEDLKVKGLTPNSMLSSPATLQSQGTADKPSLSPEVSHPHITASANPASLNDQVASEECLLSPKISHTNIATSASREGHVATEELLLSPSAVCTTPATLQGQSATEESVPTPAIVDHHNAKPASYQSQVAFEEPTTTLRVPNVVVSDLSNTVTQATSIEEDNDDTCKVKVEFEDCDAAYYNVSYGIDDYGEHYIKHVSSGGLEDNEENIGSNSNISVAKVSGDNTINRQNFQNASEHSEYYQDEGMGLSSCNVVMTPRRPEDDNIELNKEKSIRLDKEDMLDSNCNMVVTEAADSGFINEQSEDDCGERIEENNDDVIPEGELDFNEETCCCCTKTFSKSSELKKHKMMRIGEKQFVCLVCYKVYCALGKKIHEDEKKFQCLVCFRRFSQRGILNKHKRFHTGENVFKKFKKRSNLNKRKMSQAAEKLFQCLVCFKKFSRKDTLNLHERYHTTEKPQCLQCSKKFSRLSSLNRHKKLHVGKKS